VGFDGNEAVASPAVPVRAVDTTGAGDVFHAGFLYGLLAGMRFREILAFANAAAGLSCRGLGGRGSIPSLAEIGDVLKD
jgi:sugar/nucleoside kinase (ribokinase family)